MLRVIVLLIVLVEVVLIIILSVIVFKVTQNEYSLCFFLSSFFWFVLKNPKILCFFLHKTTIKFFTTPHELHRVHTVFLRSHIFETTLYVIKNGRLFFSRRRATTPYTKNKNGRDAKLV